MKQFLIILSIFFNQLTFAQAPTDICENKVPSNWIADGGKLALTDKHFKAGKQSIRWDWKSNKQSLQITDTSFQAVYDNPRSTFVIWIYNESPISDKLVFEFGKSGTTNLSFDFNLNFKGWRTAWVMYHRDMDGTVMPDMNTLKIKVPASVRKGSLYLDQVIYNSTINPRSPMRDEQVPFVNVNSDKAANAHWTALYTFSKTPHYLSLPDTISIQEKKDIADISKRYEHIILGETKIGLNGLSQIEESFSYWNIKRRGKLITGKPVYSTNDIELIGETAGQAEKKWNQQFSIKSYTELMLKVALVNRKSKDKQVQERTESIFIDLIDHLEDQGWSFGSGLGALHHLGYNFRDYYSACLLMKPLLKKSGRLDRTWKTMYWFSGLGRSQQEPSQLPLANIDVFNTLLGSMLSSVLIVDDTPEKVRQMQEFSKWFSQNIKPDFAIGGTFKPDGAVFHHGNLYPAYATGGFQGVAPILYSLSKTSFRVDEEAHSSLKRAMLTMHYYTNPLRWPISVSGRHPTGTWKVPSEPYGYLALSGTPDGIDTLDKEIASVYLKLTENTGKGKWNAKFTALGLEPAIYPSGHWSLNFGLFDIHRRQDWLLTVRGHNRYITSHESYPGANMYGRYLAYGHLEVLFPETENSSGSNFKDEGWDWNNIPGTTTLHVPLSKLRADIKNVDDFSGIEEMLISEEVFAGGTYFEKQGMFSMKLKGHDKYGMGSFRATKSWFMFDSLIVALGSGISNTIEKYPTETTLFQNVFESNNTSFYVNGESIVSFPYNQRWSTAKKLSIIDNRGIGYYLPNDKNIVLSKMVQNSRNQQDTQNTKGPVGKLIINHGNAPKNKGYEYAMLIKTDPESMNNFVSDMGSNEPIYKVLQKDSIAHSVWYAPSNLTASALFKSNSTLNDSLLLFNNKPCIIMYRNTKDSVSMSVTDPDLAFYSGPDDSPVDANGKRKEVSIYSKDWYRSASQPSVVELKIKGSWEVIPSGSTIKSTIQKDGNTLISVFCQYGLASEVKLRKK